MANVYQSQYAKIAIRALNTDSASYALTASYAMNGGGGGGTPGGSNTTVQFNDAGAFSGSGAFTFDKTTNTVNVTGSAILSGSVFMPGLTGSTAPQVLLYNTTTGRVSYTASSAFGGVGSSPGGNSNAIQYNNAGNFDGSSSFTFNGSNLVTLTGSMIVSGAISASFGPNTVGFFGTASWAQSSSRAVSSSYSLSSSYTLSSSYALSSSHALTASYVNPLQQNVTITGSLLLTQSYISKVDYIEFISSSDQPTAVGRLGWNNSDGTLSLGLKGGNLDLLIGEAEVAYVFNAESTPLTKGEVVYISGSQGNRIAVKRASNSSEGGSAGTLGLVAETIINGQTGFIITSGVLRKVDTSGYVAGKLIYLSSSAGQYTQTRPVAPEHEVRLGYVERVDNVVGSIYIKVDNGYELDELHNVLDTTTTSSYGDLLVKSGSLWISSKQLTGSYGLTGSLTATSFTGSLFGTASYVTGSVFNNTNPALSASYALTASHALNFTSIFPYTGSAIITGSLTVTGSTSVLGTSSINGIAFIGTSSAQALYTTSKITTVSGLNTIYSLQTSSYDGAFFDYTLISGLNARAGQIMSIWSGSQVRYTEITTTDIGSTSEFIFSVALTAGSASLQVTGSTGAIIKTIIKGI